MPSTLSVAQLSSLEGDSLTRIALQPGCIMLRRVSKVFVAQLPGLVTPAEAMQLTSERAGTDTLVLPVCDGVMGPGVPTLFEGRVAGVVSSAQHDRSFSELLEAVRLLRDDVRPKAASLTTHLLRRVMGWNDGPAERSTLVRYTLGVLGACRVFARDIVDECVHDQLWSGGLYSVVATKALVADQLAGPASTAAVVGALRMLSSDLMVASGDTEETGQSELDDSKFKVLQTVISHRGDVARALRAGDDVRLLLLQCAAENRLQRTLRLVLEALYEQGSAAHVTDLCHGLQMSAEAGCAATCDTCSCALTCALDESGARLTPADREVLQEALCSAAEMDDVRGCSVLLRHVTEPSEVGKALVLSARLDRQRSAGLLCQHKPPLDALDRALVTSALWSFEGMLALLLHHGPSREGMLEALWSCAFHDKPVVLRMLREALVCRCGTHGAGVEAALDHALSAACSADACRVIRELLQPETGPVPSLEAQADAYRAACAVGNVKLLSALQSSRMTAQMRTSTARACFLESTLRQDLNSVRRLLPMVGPADVDRALVHLCTVGDVELTHEVLMSVSPTPFAVQRACKAAFDARAVAVLRLLTEYAAEQNEGLATLMDLAEPRSPTHTRAAVAATLSGCVAQATSLDTTACVVTSPLGRDVLAHPKAWGRALCLMASSRMLPELDVVIDSAVAPFDPTAVTEALHAALKDARAEPSVVIRLRDMFKTFASPTAVDDVFQVAVAWQSNQNLQLLARSFTPSRDCLRRCRLLTPKYQDDTARDHVECTLRQLSRVYGKSLL